MLTIRQKLYKIQESTHFTVKFTQTIGDSKTVFLVVHLDRAQSNRESVPTPVRHENIRIRPSPPRSREKPEKRWIDGTAYGLHFPDFPRILRMLQRTNEQTRERGEEENLIA